MIFPITKWYDDLDGKNASNNVFLIKMQKGLKYPKAIWMQEYYEARLKRNPINALRSLFSKSFQRKMEIFSHEVEVQSAVLVYGVNRAEYRRKESIAMKYGYNGVFSCMELEDIQDAMLSVSPKAAAFVYDHFNSMDKLKVET